MYKTWRILLRDVLGLLVGFYCCLLCFWLLLGAFFYVCVLGGGGGGVNFHQNRYFRIWCLSQVVRDICCHANVCTSIVIYIIVVVLCLCFTFAPRVFLFCFLVFLLYYFTVTVWVRSYFNHRQGYREMFTDQSAWVCVGRVIKQSLGGVGHHMSTLWNPWVLISFCLSLFVKQHALMHAVSHTSCIHSVTMNVA